MHLDAPVGTFMTDAGQFQFPRLALKYVCSKLLGGRTIFLEGTYTNMFSGNPEQTPRYNYNQIMYKLDLASPRLELPAR